MKRANPPVKHHFTPQFLLAQWAVNDGKLWRFVRPVPSKIVQKLVAPAEVGYRPGLYATPGLPPELMQRIETHFMSPLDAAAAETHALLLKGNVNTISRPQRSAWSRFIMAQWFRTPDGLRDFKQAMRLLLSGRDADLNAQYQAIKPEDAPPTLEAIIASFGPDFVEQSAMNLLRKLCDDPTNGAHLNSMRWFVREIDGSRELLVSDALLQQPVAPGVFSPSGYVIMPIAPRKLFVAVNRTSMAEAILSLPTRELTARANRAVVSRASDYVGAASLAQERFIRANFGTEEHQTIIKRLVRKYEAAVA